MTPEARKELRQDALQVLTDWNEAADNAERGRYVAGPAVAFVRLWLEANPEDGDEAIDATEELKRLRAENVRLTRAIDDATDELVCAFAYCRAIAPCRNCETNAALLASLNPGGAKP